jgi:hypothetical protein
VVVAAAKGAAASTSQEAAKAGVFATISHFHPSLVPEGNSNCWLLALSPNIRLGWKWLTLANTSAYYNMAKITTVKGFTIQAPSIDIIFKN